MVYSLNLDDYTKLPSKKTIFDLHSHQQWLSIFATALKHQAVVHEASSRPIPPTPSSRSATETGNHCTHFCETWEAQLSGGWGLPSQLLTPLIFPLHSPGPLALKIAGRIAEFFPDAVLIMVRLAFGRGGVENRKGDP